jgi:PadR family transcriptional regulator, regulatory protein AphA
MSIRYAILGYLSWRPLSGYDIKKLLEESPHFHWSGNNNQVYRTLVELHQEEMLACQVQPQQHLPARKVYTITEKGRADLRQWLLSAPELPQLRSSFLVQLAWADQLAPAELDRLLARYEHEMQMQAVMCQEQARREQAYPARTGREERLWRAIAEHHCGFYAAELAWVQALRRDLAAQPDPKTDD